MADCPKNTPPESPEGNRAPNRELARAESSPGMEAIAPGDRWLCSELVTLHWKDASGAGQTQTANLEEIWARGAILDAEEFVPNGLTVRLFPEEGGAHAESSGTASETLPATGELRAFVCDCRRSATGFTLSVEFQEGWEWTAERFPLTHGVNSLELQKKAAAAASAGAAGKSGGGAAGPDSAEHSGTADPAVAKEAALRATDEALEQGSLFCLALHANRR